MIADFNRVIIYCQIIRNFIVDLGECGDQIITEVAAIFGSREILVQPLIPFRKFCKDFKRPRSNC